MAIVYAAPKGFDPPAWESYRDEQGRFFGPDKMNEIDDAYIARLAAEARKHRTGDLIGETIRFQVADGYALYMIWAHRPFQLVHIDLHDGYQIPEAHARGLRLQDARDMVERDKRFAALWAEKFGDVDA